MPRGLLAVFLVAILIGGVAEAAAGQGVPEPTAADPKAQVVDTVIDRMISGIGGFVSTRSLESTDARLLASTLKAVVLELRKNDLRAVVPRKVRRKVVRILRANATNLGDYAFCLQQNEFSSDVGACDANFDRVLDEAPRLGDAILDLAPYGTRSLETVAALARQALDPPSS